MSAYEIIIGDAREKLRGIADCMIDAVVTDPPYELGFMGKSWDATGIANDVAMWCEVFRTLKPGGHVVAFGGSRTYHRMTCAIEDAGFEVRDSLQWLYGNGFPKSRATALKPAHEPIVLARKPLIGTVDSNIAAYGTGGMNIDACRIETSEIRPLTSIQRPHDEFGTFAERGGRLRSTGSGANHPLGRWPANILLDERAASMLDEQSGLLGASRFFYCAKASASERSAGVDKKNTHPTVKPIALMRWLCRLITPLYGIVLDPFTGSGTTGIAAVYENLGFIGIEIDPDYARIADARLAHWKATAGLQEAPL